MTMLDDASARDWPDIPEDVVQWFRRTFYRANRSVTERLLNTPNIRETTLDDGLIEALIPHASPRKFGSGAVVEMQIHNIGGLRRAGSWETADIAVIVAVYVRGVIVDQKVGLLQSKRLYPTSGDVMDDDPVGFMYGMNAFLHPEPTSALAKIHTTYEFNAGCQYGAIKQGERQPKVISEINKRLGEAVYYLFYNPPVLPTTVRYPREQFLSAPRPKLGSRVYQAHEVDAVLTTLSKGQSPTIGQLEKGAKSNWRLEAWAELLLRCKVGRQFDASSTALIGNLLERRTGPIGAAVKVAIDLPEVRR